EDAAFAKSVGVEAAICDLHAAATASTPVADHRHHGVFATGERVRLDAELLPCLQPLLHEPAYAIESPPASSERILVRNDAFPIRLIEGKHHVEIPSGPGLDHPPHTISTFCSEIRAHLLGIGGPSLAHFIRR